MRPIAKAAGGGQGTLYRHFPTREALPLEVYQDDFASVVDSVPALLQACQPAQAVRN
ncbi:TetR/AcrR family transcriptional regulator [Amycolatopsis sp. NBC_01480]|uniref:TetR/AcrR family transcriptional regulator n=1 Tax=Amycolatopsis sp. NBC_01480 TaxID=2903562 RepID=UPI003FA48DA4